MAYNTDPRLLAAIRRYGGDPEMQAVLLATTWAESGGNPYGPGGDNGRSWGAYQEYDLGRGRGLTKEQRQDPVGSTQRALKEFQTFASRGYKGGQLAAAAQRPANAGAYAQKVESLIADARAALGGKATGSLLNSTESIVGQPALAAPNPATTASIGDGLADAIATRPKGEGLSTTVMRGLMSVVGQPALSEVAGIKANPNGVMASTAGGNNGVVNAAKRHLGVPYSWGGGTTSGPSRGFGRGANTVGFDCSSLVQNAWAAMGVKIPRVTYDQIKVGQNIDPRNQGAWKAGDLIFPHSGHVQMYIGNGKVIHAPRTGGHVEIVPVGKVMTVRRPG